MSYAVSIVFAFFVSIGKMLAEWLYHLEARLVLSELCFILGD